MSDSEGKLYRYLFVALAVWVVGVIYGSLIPFDYHPRPLDLALQHFLETPYLQLDRNDRADWIANFLLYVPCVFLIREPFFEPSRRRATVGLQDCAVGNAALSRRAEVHGSPIKLARRQAIRISVIFGRSAVCRHF